MSTIAEQAEPFLVPTIAGEQRIVLHDVSYRFYKQFCEEIGRQRLKLSFIDGELEIMVTGSPHEYFKKMLAKIIEATVFEHNIPVRSGGSMTVQRDDLEKGFEPDECWWIANESKVRSKEKIGFPSSPPPDLAVEVEITSSLVNRVSIYAAIGVPEIWRFNGKTLRFFELNPTGEYAEIPRSLAFPFLAPEELLPFLQLPNHTDETTRMRQYVQWLQKV